MSSHYSPLKNISAFLLPLQLLKVARYALMSGPELSKIQIDEGFEIFVQNVKLLV